MSLLVYGSSSSSSSSSWGSWEELVLGGAVLRHGADGAWDAVAAEVSARSSSSSSHLFFTPQECQAKYEDIMEQYSGCHEWFEGLRKRRVAELRRELEKSEDSIGCLQSKLESLTSEKDSDSNTEYNTSQTETTSLSEDGVGINYPNELTKGESSVGSFTDEPGRDSSPHCQHPTTVSLQKSKLKIHSSGDLMIKAGCDCSWVGFGRLKGKRGKRKRKGYRAGEDSVGDSDGLSSAVLMDREGSSGHIQETKLSADDSYGSLRGEYDSHLDLPSILDSVMKHKDVSIFQKRLESQKKARYKKIVRRHVDFQNISSRIGNGSISSAKELLSDLLLLSNNALIFYPKNSPEHKSALVLRDLLSTTFLQGLSLQNPIRNSGGDRGGSILNDVVKTERPKSVRPCNSRAIETAEASGEGDDMPHNESSEKGSRTDVALTSAGRKRGIGRPAKGGPRGGKRRQEGPDKGRKRARR